MKKPNVDLMTSTNQIVSDCKKFLPLATQNQPFTETPLHFSLPYGIISPKQSTKEGFYDKHD